MSLAANILQHRSAKVLTDLRSTVTYADLAREFDCLDHLWHATDGANDRDGAVVLAGRNDLGSVIAGLHLLARGRAVYYWRPPASLIGNAFPWSDLPDFCTSAVMTRDSATEQPAHADYQVILRPLTAHPVRPLTNPYVYLGTSGTTARPKLAAYTPERLLGNAENCVRRLQLTAEDRILIPLAVAHMYGFGAALLPSLLAGASICLIPQVNLLTYLQAEREFDPTVVFLTPALVHQLVSARKQGRKYRLTVLGADRIHAESFANYEARHGCTVCIYGSTELGAVASGSPDDDFETRQQTSGRLLDNVRLIADPRAMTDETGMITSLCFEHPFAMAGYANASGEPELPSDVFRDGVYLTNDLGELDDQGNLHVHGRRDDCVKRDGYLVAFGDVEQALEQFPAITRAIVMGGASTSRGVALVAFCVSTEGGSQDLSEIRRHCLCVLPAHAVPDHILFLAALPLSSTGKPDRRALQSRIPQI